MKITKTVLLKINQPAKNQIAKSVNDGLLFLYDLLLIV